MSLQLYSKQIEDKYTRENFDKIEQAFNDLVFTLGDFRFFEFNITGAQEDYRLYHNLGFNPNDVIVTKAIGSSFEFNYNAFNDEYLTVKTTGDLYLRCFIGNMRGDEVTGTNAFASITDDVGGTPGGGGGATEKDYFTVSSGFLSTPERTLPSVAITDSEIVFLNGLEIDDTNYSITGDLFTWNDSNDLRVGDKIHIRYAN